jgi:hypothetical protein
MTFSLTMMKGEEGKEQEVRMAEQNLNENL